MKIQDLKKFGVTSHGNDRILLDGISCPLTIACLDIEEAFVMYTNHCVHSFCLRDTPAEIPVDPCCPLVFVSYNGAERKCLAFEFNWAIDSIYWTTYKPDIEGMEAVISHLMTKAA